MIPEISNRTPLHKRNRGEIDRRASIQIIGPPSLTSALEHKDARREARGGHDIYPLLTAQGLSYEISTGMNNVLWGSPNLEATRSGRKFKLDLKGMFNEAQPL
jgi:hypothetical protein